MEQAKYAFALQVQHLVAGQALQVASKCWHEQRAVPALGALVLVDILGVTGVSLLALCTP